MASTIDITKPITGAPTTQSVRDNFAAAHTEIEALQQQIGYADYNDYATQLSPISVTAATWTKLTNDTLGPQTRIKLPSDVTAVWDSVANQCDFSELPIDTMVNLRADLTVATTGANHTISLRADMAIGGVGPYTIELGEQTFKSSGDHKLIQNLPFYIGSADMRNHPAELKVYASNNCTVKVHGWYFEVTKNLTV